MLEETLTKYKLKDKPVQIYNCDESGMPLEFKLSKIIAEKGAKRYDCDPVSVLVYINKALIFMFSFYRHLERCKRKCCDA